MKDQKELALDLMAEMEECIEDGCWDNLLCFLDNLARAGVRLTEDKEGVASQEYMGMIRAIAERTK